MHKLGHISYSYSFYHNKATVTYSPSLRFDGLIKNTFSIELLKSRGYSVEALCKMTRSSLVRNHVRNRPVPVESKHAYFLLMPPTSSSSQGEDSMRGGIDIHLRHAGSQEVDSLGPLYCKTWSVPSGILREALQTLDLHVKAARRAHTKIVVALFAHANPARKSFVWGDREFLISSVVRWASSSGSVKSILLLGCSTAIPIHSMPAFPDKAIIAVTRSVSYDHLWLFCQNYFHNYRQYSRENPSWTAKEVSLNAMNASCNAFVTHNKVCQYP